MEKTLKDLKNGARAVVLRLDASGRTRLRLAEMGLTPGVSVKILRRAPLADPIEIALRGYTLTLRAEDAAQILIAEERPS